MCVCVCVCVCACVCVRVYVCVCVVQAESYLMVVDHADRQVSAGDKAAEDEKGQGEPSKAILTLTLHNCHIYVQLLSIDFT